MTKPTTGPYSYKRYKCDRCGNITKQGTNHWGQIYNMRCEKCSWKNPLQPFVTMTCVEKMPKKYARPTPWKSVRLGDIVEFK